MNELFIIRENKHCHYYVTNDAVGCLQALAFLDSLVYKGNRLETFERQCAIKGISITKINRVLISGE